MLLRYLSSWMCGRVVLPCPELPLQLDRASVVSGGSHWCLFWRRS